ncbi:MAG: aminoglycoside phosphotransferase family protein [Rickettsiaceae bacterium]
MKIGQNIINNAIKFKRVSYIKDSCTVLQNAVQYKKTTLTPSFYYTKPSIRMYSTNSVNCPNNMIIDSFLVSRLVTRQFPQFKNLPIKAVEPGGWDNRTFRLGNEYLVRLPSNEEYSIQVDKEQKWLPYLAKLLPLEIPEPIELGKADDGYPWQWSIYKWIDGDTAASSRHTIDLNSFAKQLANFLKSLHLMDASNGPNPGIHNFQRGGELSYYDSETRSAITELNTIINPKTAHMIWDEAISTKWQRPPVWVHGDISAGNLLVKDEVLSAVIDFGMLSVGDPACDLSIAWTFFDKESREVFKSCLELDNDTWLRARGWTLWKALIVTADFSSTNEVEKRNASQVLNTILTETQ